MAGEDEAALMALIKAALERLCAQNPRARYALIAHEVSDDHESLCVASSYGSRSSLRGLLGVVVVQSALADGFTVDDIAGVARRDFAAHHRTQAD